MLHSFPTLISITLSVDLHVHCIIHLTQDCFLHKSSGRLKLEKVAKDVALVSVLRNQMFARPPNGVMPPSTLGKERDGNMNPQRKDCIIIGRTN